MITVLEAIKLSSKFLEKKGIDSPRINAELLLADVIGCKRLDLYLAFDRPLTDAELTKYRDLLKRRSSFEPLQYIIGTVEFYGLLLKVNSSVLIPRPETELLVENIITRFSNIEKLSILDIGSGSGSIAIALAKNLIQAQVISTDISDDALILARENSRKHNLSERINFIKHDIRNDDMAKFPLFDLIVSNPPYVSKESYFSLQKEIRDYEPRAALTDESDGLTFYKVISERVSGNLKNGGALFFEIAQGQCEEVKSIMTKNNFTKIKVIKDYQNIERIVFGELG